jgi:ATP-dependent protease ClpP protease subunit
MTGTMVGMAEPLQKTPEEIAATVNRLEAEARKFAAEAERAEIEAAGGRILLAQAEENYSRFKVSDDQHRVYRFITPVTKGSVLECAESLHRWSRLTPKCPIEIIFSSPGGSIFDGFVLYDEILMLRAKGHHVTTGTVGMAASMAGVLLQAGDTRWMGSEALILIHRASFGAIGKSYEVEDEIELVKRLEQRIVKIFTERTDGLLTSQKLKRGWERKDWWIGSEEALELGVGR